MAIDPVTAVAELAKFALMYHMERMRIAGMTDAQIDQAFREAKASLLARDPANIPER